MRAFAAYRPVVEIGTGDIVGIDLVVEGTGAADRPPAAGEALADQHFLDRAFSEAAPILRAHPALKLSLPPIADHAALMRATNTLRRVLPRFSVLPGQVVMAASCGIAAPSELGAVFAAIRSAGMLLSLDGVDRGEGGGLMALAHYQPDFITISGDPAGVAGQAAEGLTILSAIVNAARELGVGVVVHAVAGPEEIERLRGIGITTATGPAFGPPLKAHAMAALVAAAAAAPEPEARVA